MKLDINVIRRRKHIPLIILTLKLAQLIDSELTR